MVKNYILLGEISIKYFFKKKTCNNSKKMDLKKIMHKLVINYNKIFRYYNKILNKFMTLFIFAYHILIYMLNIFFLDIFFKLLYKLKYYIINVKNNLFNSIVL